MSYNQITNLPEDFFHVFVEALKDLEELDLHNNQLRQIPKVCPRGPIYLLVY